MYDPGYEIQTEYMEGENDSQYGENSHFRRFMQNYQSPNGRRQKVKNNHFFTLQSHENLPVVFPKTRQCLDNSTRLRTASPQSIFSQSHDKPSINIFKEQDDQSYPLVTVPSKTTLNTQGSPRIYAARVRPKNIPQEKERLYDEILNLKNSIHALKDENLKLKTKINSLEKDSVKFEKIIASQDVFIVEKDVTSKSSESHFVITLKNQLRDLKGILNSREIELAELYKSVKYTKIHEIEIQSKAFAEEAARLKKILEQVIQERTQNLMQDHDKSRLQEECFLQASQLQALQRNNEEMTLAIKVLEQMSAEAKKKSHEKERRLKKEIEKQKQLVNEKERENMRLRNEINGISSNTSRSHQNLSPSRGFIGSKEDFTTELEAKKTEVAGLLEQIAEKDARIQSLETQVKELTILNKPTILQNGEKINYRRTNSGRRSMFEDFRSAGLKDQVDEDRILEATLGFHQFLSQIDAESIQASPKGGISPERTTKNRFEYKKVQKVRIEDVKEFAYEINLIFRVKHLVFEEVVKNIWPEKVQETNNVSIKEMSQILKKEPFSVRENSDSVLIARYLIENTEDEYILYDENLEKDVASVENSLKKLIGTIPRWDKEATKELHDSISETLNKHHGSLRENLRALCKSRYMTRRVFQDVCRLVDIFLSEEQVEYIVTKLYEQANNVHKLKIDDLFEIFAQKPKEPELLKKSTRESRRSSDFSNKSSEMPDFFVRRNSRSFTATDLLPMARHFIRESELEDEEENSPVKKKNFTRIDITENDNHEEKYPKPRENRLLLGLKRVTESDHSPVANQSPVASQEGEKKESGNQERVPKNIEDLEKNNTSANDRDQTQDMKEFDPKFYSDSPVSNPRVQIFSTLEVGSDKDLAQYGDSENNEEENNTKDQNTSREDRASESAGSDSSRKRSGFQRPYVVTMNQYTENKSTFYKTERMKPTSLFLEEKKDFLSDHGLQLNAISEREETFEERSARLEKLEDTESKETKLEGRSEEGYSQEISAQENLVKSSKESKGSGAEIEKVENLEKETNQEKSL